VLVRVTEAPEQMLVGVLEVMTGTGGVVNTVATTS
jgi:hypothetical protein